MEIHQHFEDKKKRFHAFFDSFHSLVDQLRTACETEIDK